MSPSLAQLKEVLEGTHQEHVLSHWEELSANEKEALSKQIMEIRYFQHLNQVLKESLALLDDANSSSAASIEPPPASCIFDSQSPLNKDKVEQYEGVGLEAVAAGKVAVLLMAGGSGTRLGVSIPKGMFTCPLLKQQKSLFQFHSEKILRVEELATARCPSTKICRIPFVIMTSEQNNQQTSTFFSENRYFGLQKDQVFFFIQSSLPCYDEASGKILMETKSSMCVAPGGNGGVYQSFAASSLLGRLKEQGVEMVQIFGVDNLLAAVADPMFFGYAFHEHKEVAVKTTPKSSPHERVGVFALLNQKWGVVEYTEIGALRCEERDPTTGALRFNCANIVTHVCSTRFLEFAANQMRTEKKFHAARKSIPTFNGQVPGVKLEAFIFDMFAYCNDVKNSARPAGIDAFGILQVDRADEFAPIKNADTATTDTPATAARQMQELHTRWIFRVLLESQKRSPNNDVQQALGRLEKKEIQVEVSSLVSYKGEQLDGLIADLVKRIALTSSGDVLVLEKGLESKC